MSEQGKANGRSSSSNELLKIVIFAAAILGLAGLIARWLDDWTVSAVLAGVLATPYPTPASTATQVSVSPPRSPSATLPPTATISDPTASPTLTPIGSEPVASPTPSPPHELPVHKVEEGETLADIAHTYDVSVEALVLLNELENPDLLYVGQALRLPRGASSSSPKDVDDQGADPAQVTPNPSLHSPDELIRGRWIDVDLSEQRLTAYEDSVAVRATLVSTGLPNTPTPLGEFRIWIKFRYDDMAGADYYIEDVPYVMYFHEGYGLHGVTWHGNFGHPMSHGCVNLPTSEAAWLFEWADVGTLVKIHE